jgi:hypothetical protein
MKQQIATGLKSANSFRFFLAFFGLIFSINLTAQPGINIYTELGENNVSHGLYVESSAMAHYKFGNNVLETGFQIDLKNNKTVISGYTINATRDFVVKDVPFELQGFGTWTDFSEILRETNYGALLKMHRNHFQIAIGTNFRTYSFSRKAVKDYEIDKSAESFHEVYNIMYSFSYNLKPVNNPWNIAFEITDIDYFIINHETNPILNLNTSYKLNSNLSFYAEASYKIAGATNMAVNYFGFFLRTGISWNF